MKEMGGYMQLELPNADPYYRGENVHPVDTGRTAIWRAVDDAKVKRLILPYYICQSVLQVCAYQKIPYVFYSIDKNFMPLWDETPQEGDGFLYVNWFGIQNPKKMELLGKNHRTFLLDNTQGFFAEPRVDGYTIYSARKFFGVSDGAYVIKNGIKPMALPRDLSYPYATHLLKCIELGAHSAYEENLENEKRFDDFQPKEMSLLTQRILGSIDYEKVKVKRKENFAALHKELGRYNEIPIQEELPAMVYPLLVAKEGLRQFLVQRKIYVPHWWEWVLHKVSPQSFEAHLSRFLVPLPIDQRYTTQDMKNLAHIITGYLHEKG